MATPRTLCREGDPVDDDSDPVSAREEVLPLLECEQTTGEEQASSDYGTSQQSVKE